MPERRVPERAPPLDLRGEELSDVVPGGQANRARVRLERLHEHAAGAVAATPPRKLCHELERPLLRSEIWEPEAGVGVDDGCKRDSHKVVPFRHHLRAEQDRSVGGGEARERLGGRAWPRDRVCVEPDSLELREPLLQLTLEPLRPRAEPRELARTARGAGDGNGHAPAAVVTAEKTVSV